ncbi:MAG: heterodisulfide reductase [Chloroflexi bacterium]|nr:heterodisulfide reductase [Chloroflexota bacterium]
MSEQASDPNFKYEVAAQPGGENLQVCFSCGTCTAGCPVTEADERYSPRRIIRKILLGQRREVLSDPLLWYCETCYACSVYCPQNVKFGDVMRALRAMAVAEGYFSPELMQRIREVDRLAHAMRLKLVQEAIDRAEDPAPAPLERAAAEIEQMIKDKAL